MDARDPIVRLRDVERRFEQGGQSLFALRRVSLDVARGEWLTIMGPSGAGKSTLLGVLGLQDVTWTGSFWLGDHAVHELAPEARARLRAERIGFVFQSYHLLDDLTVEENLDVPLAYRNLSRPERASRVAHALDRFGLAARRGLFPRQLSGGHQQLVGVARALVGDPELLLADEPTGSLHSDQADEVLAVLERLHREGTTIVLVTHSREVAARGQRTVTLRDGWITDEERNDATLPHDLKEVGT